MTAAGPVRVACVGAGYFSRFHYDSWSRLADVELIAACDLDIEKARATGLTAYGDLGLMLQQQSPDLLDVILPPAAHADAISLAAECGVATIICQKPFCRTLDEARTVAAAARAAGSRIVVHENFRFQPWYRKARELIDGGRIGAVRQVTFRLRPGDGRGPQAYLDRQPYFQQMPRFLVRETGVHWIDTFRYLLGDPSAVYADLRKENPVIAGEDAGYIIFDHPGGARALFDGNRTLDHAADNLRCTMGEALIEGTEGILTLFGDGSLTMRGFLQTDSVEVLHADRSSTFGGDCVHALQAHVIEGLVDGRPLENTVDAYLPVIEIEQAIYESARTGRKIALTAA